MQSARKAASRPNIGFVEQREVYACVVHFGDQAMGGEFEVTQVGREELLCEVFAVDRPDDSTLFVIDTEMDVGEV